MHRWIPALVALLVGCKSVPDWERGKKYVHAAMRANVGSLDPVRNSTQYAGMAQAQVYDTLFEYEYLKRPYQLKPLLAADMPEVSEDGRTYTFTLKRGVMFHDSPCFAGGRGRELVAQDVVWSLMRMADKDLTPGGWWLYQDRIVGFDEFQARMNERAPGDPFDFDAHIEGLQALDRYRVQVVLKRPFPQFLYILAMGYTAPVPRECVEYYGKEFGSHAVGTGPFVLRHFERDQHLIFDRNPRYHEVRYPTEADPQLAKRGLLAAAGQRVPFLDGIVFHIYQTDEPMWLKFRVGDLDLIQTPAEYQKVVFTEDWVLRPKQVREGLGNHNDALLDYVYLGFNMEDPIVGDTDKGRLVRCAVTAAIDVDEINEAFYNSAATIYDGPIPPGLDGHVPGRTSPYHGPQPELVAQLLEQAGYPGGDGLPVLNLYTGRSGNSSQQVEMIKRQLDASGIRIEPHFDSFAELSTKLKRKKAQMFSLAWGADYPDAENFLQLFYGPNGSPGSNNFNYDNPEYNALYERSRVMFPSPERTELFQEMRQIVIDDCVAARNMARTRFWLWNPRLRNAHPTEVYYKWFKYLDVEPLR